MASPRASKPPEAMTKNALLDAIGRRLSKAEVIALYKAVSHGYVPYAHDDPALGAPRWDKTS